MSLLAIYMINRKKEINGEGVHLHGKYRTKNSGYYRKGGTGI